MSDDFVRQEKNECLEPQPLLAFRRVRQTGRSIRIACEKNHVLLMIHIRQEDILIPICSPRMVFRIRFIRAVFHERFADFDHLQASIISNLHAL